MGFGEQYVMMAGIKQMLMWHVVNLDICLLVRNVCD